jgi:hypothetical protein
MKHYRFSSLMGVFALCLVLMGCPYESPIPLSEAATKPSDNLFGTWEESGNPSVTITVSKADGNHMKVVKSTANEGSEPTIENYNAYITEISGKIFLNVSEVSDYETEPKYYFYKIEKNGEFKLQLFEVTPNIRETFTSSDEMKKFFSANMNNSYFYSTGELTYFKIK